MRCSGRRFYILCSAFPIAVLAGLWLGAADAHAQSLERNLPEQATLRPSAIVLTPQNSGSGDETPFGMDLLGIHLIGLEGKVRAVPPQGITLEGVGGVPEAQIMAALSPYIGQPVSGALIGRIQAAIATVWREAGYPFMSVTVPPQEITSGVLTLRVVEFRAGTITVDPKAQARSAAALPGKLRLKTSERINAVALKEDLDWINRNSYRRVESLFSPGDARGVSNVTLDVSERRPWSAFVSYSNTGNETTDLDRWGIGADAWFPGLNDMTASYRFTRSGHTGGPDGIFLPVKETAGYFSHAARIDVPVFARQSFSIAPNFVATNEFTEGTPFSFENRTFELPITYRSAVSNLLPGRYLGEVSLGVEPKWFSRTTRFFNLDLPESRVSLFNLVLGWSNGFAKPDSYTTVDVRLKTNLDGVLGHNSAQDWFEFTGGRVNDNSYVYGGIDINRQTALSQDLTWISQFSTVLADKALPDSERFSLGGYFAVRGYGGSDAAVDTGFLWRNDLRLSVSDSWGRTVPGDLVPGMFLDVGQGYDFDTRDSITVASAGFNVDYSVANLVAGLSAARALKGAAQTDGGDWTLIVNMRVNF